MYSSSWSKTPTNETPKSIALPLKLSMYGWLEIIEAQVLHGSGDLRGPGLEVNIFHHPGGWFSGLAAPQESVHILIGIRETQPWTNPEIMKE